MQRIDFENTEYLSTERSLNIKNPERSGNYRIVFISRFNLSKNLVLPRVKPGFKLVKIKLRLFWALQTFGNLLL